MRMKLTYNYWLMMLAWVMFINDHCLLALSSGLFACVVLLSMRKRINLWRMSCLSLISYSAVLLTFSGTNILYYFPKLPLFMFVICANSLMTHEYLYLFKPKFLYPYLLFVIVGVSVFSMTVVLLPNSSYTLFTKRSLYLMVCLIFLPYLIPMMCCLFRKRNSYVKAKPQNKEAVS